MAKEKTVPGYRVEVTGTYIATNEHGVKTKKFYKDEAFDLPEIVAYKNGANEVEYEVNGEKKTKWEPNIVRENASRANVALHMIRRFYIEDRLREKYPDYVSVKTCEVFSKEKTQIPVGTAGDVTGKDVQKMSLSELKQFVDLLGLNVILGDYYDLGDKKTAVEMVLKQKQEDDVLAGKSERDLAAELLEAPESPLFG